DNDVALDIALQSRRVRLLPRIGWKAEHLADSPDGSADQPPVFHEALLVFIPFSLKEHLHGFGLARQGFCNQTGPDALKVLFERRDSALLGQVDASKGGKTCQPTRRTAAHTG